MREKFLFIVLSGLVITGGFLYYARIQKAVAPANTQNDFGGTRLSSPELNSEIKLDGLNHVWDISFLPDNTEIFTERSGTISKIEDDRKVVLHTISNVYVRGEGGLMGLVVDPDFAENRFIYACYNTAEDIRVSRWKVNDEATAFSEQTEIITGMPANPSGRHSGCRPRFDPVKNLWVGTGDAAIGANPQDPKSLGGKILRIDRNGNATKGNLGEPFDARIYSYGHRNTQGIAFFATLKAGSFGFSIEHGPGRDDEVNQLVKGNFGWDPVPGYNERVSMTDTSKYPNAISSVWSSGGLTIAPSGATMIVGSKWKAFENQLAVAVLKDEHVHLYELDASGKKVINERRLFVGEYGRIRSVVMGPDEGLYITTDNGNDEDEIIKITPR